MKLIHVIMKQTDSGFVQVADFENQRKAFDFKRRLEKKNKNGRYTLQSVPQTEYEE